MSRGVSRLARTLIRVAAVLVPGARRAEWREEWEAELTELQRQSVSAPSRDSGWLQLRFAAGSLVHAVWELKYVLMFDLLAYDVRHAARTLGRAPSFTLVAVVTLALGVGANATVFSLTNRLLLRAPAGIGDAAGLVQIGRNADPDRFDNWALPVVAAMDEELAGVFEGVAGYAAASAVVGRSADAEHTGVQLVTANYFDVLRVRHVLGRGFGPEAGAAPGSAAVAVISHALWQRRFAGDTDVLGRALAIDGTSFRIVGVTPAGFHGADVFRSPADVFLPIGMQHTVRRSPDDILSSWDNSWVWAVARLRPGVDREAAAAATGALLNRIAAREPLLAGVEMQIVDGVGARPAERRAAGFVSIVLLALVALVLLIACANLGGLALARGAARAGEVGVRLALGATRGRVVWQLLVENVLLGVLGGIAAIAVAIAVAPRVAEFLPVAVSVGFEPDARVLVLTLLVGGLAGALFGLVPALTASRREPAAVLSGGATGRGATARADRARGALVIAQFALCFAVVAAAGLLVRSARNVYTMHPGFDTAGVVVITLATRLTDGGPDTGGRLRREIERRVSELPGVAAVGMTVSLPIADAQSSRAPVAPGMLPGPGTPAPAPVYTNRIDGDYFAALGIPVLSGRGFERGDIAGATVVVDRRFAERFFPGEDVVGRAVPFLAVNGQVPVVIGVVAEHRTRGVADPPVPTVFLPFPAAGTEAMTLVVRVRGNTGAALSAIRRELAVIAADLPVLRSAELRDLIARSMGDLHLAVRFVVVFGALALVLAAVGLYGLLSYSVARRRREVGVRVALGATPGDIQKLVLQQSLRLALTGLAVGVGLALAMSRLIGRLLYGVAAVDPATMAATALLLLIVAGAATALPTRAAVRARPADVLRE